MIELKNFKKQGFDTEEERLKAVEDLRTFITTPGWKFLERYIKLNISEMERKILENELGKEIKYSEEDLEKAIRLFLIGLKDLPEKELRLLNREDDDEEDDGLDPYYKK